ncbi:MAG TPA: tRNA (cytidine(34)-2'-O)-methyltransferase [Trueperaceae bacterium]|nr:tRNA (cytidine(34)-2'-O)-methyltransferase [Trueperaceae bacterium]
MLHVALLEPEIAGNTGQIARSCLAVGARLHLVRPLGFRLDDRSLRRAGMDYWERVDVRVHPGWDAFRDALAAAFDAGRVFAFSAAAGRGPAALDVRLAASAGDGAHEPQAVLLFGSESRGLPAAVLEACSPVRLPMRAGARSLNLSASVAAALYLAWAQADFAGGA